MCPKTEYLFYAYIHTHIHTYSLYICLCMTSQSLYELCVFFCGCSYLQDCVLAYVCIIHRAFPANVTLTLKVPASIHFTGENEMLHPWIACNVVLLVPHISLWFELPQGFLTSALTFSKGLEKKIFCKRTGLHSLVQNHIKIPAWGINASFESFPPKYQE